MKSPAYTADIPSIERTIMGSSASRPLLLASLLALSGGIAQAQETGRVISVTPIVQQVAQPRQVCSNETVAVQGQRSGAGAAIGAIAGGLLGNTVGHGGGRAAATMLGIFGGAVVGDQVEGRGAPQYQNVQRCSTQTFYENRATAYNVVYEYGGKQYSTQMDRDPGPTIELQVTPVNAPPPAVQGALPMAPPPVYSQPQAVYTQPPVVYTTPGIVTYTEYYPRVVRPPVGINLDIGVGGGWYPRHHGPHWR